MRPTQATGDKLTAGANLFAARWPPAPGTRNFRVGWLCQATHQPTRKLGPARVAGADACSPRIRGAFWGGRPQMSTQKAGPARTAPTGLRHSVSTRTAALAETAQMSENGQALSARTRGR